jgi:peptide/nickel transport system substrate-binding protein
VESPFYRYGFDFDSTLKKFNFDPQEAERLLHLAGWIDSDNDGILEKDSLEFRFELLIPSGNPLGAQVASILREDLYMLGIEMNIRQLEWSVFINNYIRNHKFDACFLAWAMGLKQDPKQIWHSESAKGRGSNAIEFRNSEADSIIEAARVEFDPVKRRELYCRFQQILSDQQPYTFMFSTKFKPAYDRRFKGVKWYPFRPGYQLDEWFVPKAEQRYH